MAASSRGGVAEGPAVSTRGAGGPGGPDRAAAITKADVPAPSRGGMAAMSAVEARAATTSSRTPSASPMAAAASASSSSTATTPAAATSKIGVVMEKPEELCRPLSSVKRASVAEAMNSRWRATMEDAHVLVDEFGGDRDTGLFGVYDGHGGRNVAKYLQKHLHETIAAELHDKDARTVEECMKTAFLMTDIECAKTGEAASGSTAVVCIVRKEPPKSRGKPWKRYIFTANCGDARAVLCHVGSGVRLSHDHKASEAQEIRRIQAAGGFVTNGRVMGVLAVTRSFGDYALKRYVTCEPYTSTTKINEESQFLVIACDGVWDVMSDQEACDVVLAHCRAASASVSLETLQDSAAERLVRASLERNSRDNVTAMVVFL